MEADGQRLEAGDLITQPDTPPPGRSRNPSIAASHLDISLETQEVDPFASSGETHIQAPPEPQEPLISFRNSTEDLIEPPTIDTQPVIVDTTTSPLRPVKNELESANSSLLSPQASRLNPKIPAVSPIHYQLPTRRWTDPTVFFDVPFVDLISETITKAFGNQPSHQRPRRPLMVLEQALEYPDPYVPLISSKRFP